MVNSRLDMLKKAMKKQDIDVYYFNTSDYHMSEYVPEYFKTIYYYSGFSGSLATLLVTLNDAYIFVDGRYHVQADKQCLPNGIKVIKLGTQEGIEPLDFLKTYFANKTVGFDGKRTSVSFAKKILETGIKTKNIDIYSDLIDDREELRHNQIYELPLKYTGLARRTKLELIAHVLKDNVHVISNLESIAYLLNLRGSDIKYTPVFLSYLVLDGSDVCLFVDQDSLPAELRKDLELDGIIIRPYDSFYESLDQIKEKKIIIDENKTSYETFIHLNLNKNTIYNLVSPVEQMKAIKNETEIKNMKQAHIYDGISLLRFWMWIKETDKNSISEYDAAQKLDSFRRQNRANDLSFGSIVAYNENAALMHYYPEKDNAAMLSDKGILLFDSGGQYDEGTTDITRTIALGETSDEIKKYFTLVLKSMFNLSEIKFLKGLSGNQLDILARKDLWKQGVDYRCGTGHGVGYNLSVHETPPNIRYGHTDNGSQLSVVLPGMIFSDEPGVYFEGKYGIRCENLLLCKTDETNDYGQFLSFEHLSLMPFDLDLIDKNYLDEETTAALNRYHEKVYKTLMPYLNDEEAKFLKEKTRAI